MGFYAALNYWVLGGFGGEKSAIDAIDDVRSMGLDGVELTFGDCLKTDISKTECEAIAAHAKAKGVGLRSLATGAYWQCSLGAADEAERQRAIEFTEKYIRVAQWLGVENILVVPGAVHVAWDPGRPVVPYKTVWEQSTKSLKTLSPVAEKANVNICLENVWNKFLLSPMEMKLYLDQFASKRVGAYFDVGNVVLNGFPEHWIEILGARIKAVHIKNFKSEDCGGGLHGFGDDLLVGDVNFPAVFKALKAIGFQGPLTAEMIPFCRLPDLVLPDMALAQKTAEQLKTLVG